MQSQIIERGSLPPEKVRPAEGYKEASVCFIDRKYAVYSNEYRCGKGERIALKWLAILDEILSKIAMEERASIIRARMQMRHERRERRERARRKRIGEAIDWAMAVILCAEILAAVMI